MLRSLQLTLGIAEPTPREVARALAEKVKNHSGKPFDGAFAEGQQARWGDVLEKQGVEKAYSAYQAEVAQVPESPRRVRRNEMMAATGLAVDAMFEAEVPTEGSPELAAYRAYCAAQVQSIYDALPTEPSVAQLISARRRLCPLTRVDDPMRQAVELQLVCANMAMGAWPDAYAVLTDVLAQAPDALLVRAHDPLLAMKHEIMAHPRQLAEYSQDPSVVERKGLLLAIEAAQVKAMADQRARPEAVGDLARARAGIAALNATQTGAMAPAAEEAVAGPIGAAQALLARLPAGDNFRVRGFELVAKAQAQDPVNSADALKLLGWWVKHPRLRYLQLSDQAEAMAGKTPQVIADIQAVRAWGTGASAAGIRLALWVKAANEPNAEPPPDITTAEGRNAVRDAFRDRIEADIHGFTALKSELYKALEDMMQTTNYKLRGRPLLLNGPPGTAKTKMCEVLAEALGCHFIKINGSSLQQPGGIAGHEQVYRSSQPGVIIRAMCDAPLDKPLMIVIDELGDVGDDTVKELAPALDETRVSYHDANLGEHCPFDLSWTWFAFTTNNAVVGKIESRCNQKIVPPLNDAQRRAIIGERWEDLSTQGGGLPSLSLPLIEWLRVHTKSDDGARALQDALSALALAARREMDKGRLRKKGTLSPEHGMELICATGARVDELHKAEGGGFVANLQLGDLVGALLHKTETSVRFIGGDAAWRLDVEPTGLLLGCISRGRRKGIAGLALRRGRQKLPFELMNLMHRNWSRHDEAIRYTWAGLGLPEPRDEKGAVNPAFQRALQGGDSVDCQVVFLTHPGVTAGARRQTMRQGFDRDVL